jgi:hypothetical protein
MKTFQVKVYDLDDTYLATWKDIVSDINFNNELNSAGGQLQIKLARDAGDFGEGTDVDFGHKVKVICFDNDAPDGTVIFQGFISSYTPVYTDNTIDIIVLSYGAELNDFIIDGTPTSTELNKTYTTSLTSYWDTSPYFRIFGQTFTATTDEELTSIKVLLSGPAFGNPDAEMVLKLFPTVPFSGSQKAISITTNLIASKQFTVRANTTTSTTPTEYTIVFSSTVQLTAGSDYFFGLYPLTNNGRQVNVYYTTVSASYIGGQKFEAVDAGSIAGSQWLAPTGGDLYFEAIYKAPATKAPFNSFDPSDILRAVLDSNYQQGGNVYYSDTSIDTTSSTVSYTFSVDTILEGVSKCVELAPANWYWYLDYGTNLIHFREKSDTPDHTFSFEKDIIDARFEKRIEEITNVIYFTGGDIGGGINLFKKYTIPASITKYGTKALKYTDGRVTVASTADTISNNILATKSEPELRVTLEILDNNNDMDMGYDIESIQVGDVIAVRNITQQVGIHTWDVGRFDEAYWDYNIYNLSSLQMQIQKLEYKQDSVVISASTIPLDVNKRIEDINRNLEILQTANNPTTPS